MRSSFWAQLHDPHGEEPRLLRGVSNHEAANASVCPAKGDRSPKKWERSRMTPGYREDIDWLRAIAVLSVVAFHFEMHGIYGGFVGVDIFFVISGYLITGIIQSEVKESRFSFAR